MDRGCDDPCYLQAHNSNTSNSGTKSLVAMQLMCLISIAVLAFKLVRSYYQPMALTDTIKGSDSGRAADDKMVRVRGMLWLKFDGDGLIEKAVSVHDEAVIMAQLNDTGQYLYPRADRKTSPSTSQNSCT